MVQAGDVIAGRYRIESELGGGASGVVFSAHHLVTRQKVVLKCLRVADGASVDDARFETEIAVSSACEHKNLVKLLDAGRIDEASRFLVYEYLDGMTLDVFLASRGAPDLREILSLMGEVLEALRALHDAGIVHCDVKPANIMVIRTESGPAARLLDLGLCTFLEDGHATPGAIIGTPEYCAPEQLAGETIDRSTDLYAWAVVLIECVAGKRCFEGMTPNMVIKWQMDNSTHRIPSSLAGHPVSRRLRIALRKKRTARDYDPAGLLGALAVSRSDEGPSATVIVPRGFLFALVPSEASPVSMASLLSVTERFGASILSASAGAHVLRLDSYLENSHDASTVRGLSHRLASELNVAVAIDWYPGGNLSERELLVSADVERLLRLGASLDANEILMTDRAAAAAGIRRGLVGAASFENEACFRFGAGGAVHQAPMFGREDELRWLRQQVEQQGTWLICIVGETGAGKSRLVEGLQTTIQGRKKVIDGRQRVSGIDNSADSFELIVVEDAAIDTIRDAVEALRRNLATGGAIVVTTTDVSLPSTLDDCACLVLPEMGRGEIEQLLSHEFGFTSGVQLNRLITRSGGNPHFAQLLAAELADRDLSIPFVPTAITRRFLDELEPEPALMAAVRYAAFLGEEFPRDLSWIASDKGFGQLVVERLSYLIEPSRFNGVETFRFRRRLVFEAFSNIPEAPLRARHAGLLRMLDASLGDLLPQFRAHHAFAVGDFGTAADDWYAASQLCRASAEYEAAMEFS
ncbi:MAG: protein kinase, partial [Pseudomonadales bacterium]|nr:protein kinase [Pseudomonadales bacterium]